MAKAAHTNVRSTAALILCRVIQQKNSLNAVFAEFLPQLAVTERSLCQQLCYGVLRHYHSLDALSQQLLQKKLKNKDQDVHALLLVGLYQLRSMRTPAHAAISETVDAVAGLGKHWAKGVINACLRQYQRREQQLEEAISCQETGVYSHSGWLIERYREDWPDHWQAMLAANNTQAPMILRVNRQKQDRDAYQQHLLQADIISHPLIDCPDALLLEQACDVQLLPGFEQGWVSVQDGAAQNVLPLLALQPGMQVLDACSAPGGKTCHILEAQPDCDVLALDIDETRLQRVRESLTRLNLTATTQCADAANIESWWQGQTFDRILIDAPCTGSGVIRRHPDIKLLRMPEDVAHLAHRQQQLLDALWPLLKPDGILTYTTCSVFKAENEHQIAAFLKRHADAREWLPHAAPARKAAYGYQRLPGDTVLDGFYYACLHRAV